MTTQHRSHCTAPDVLWTHRQLTAFVCPLILFSTLGFGCGSRHPSDKFKEAEKFYREGTKLMTTDPPRSVKLLTKSLDLNPNAPPALFNRSLAHAGAGNAAEAVADADRLEQIEPKLAAELRKKLMVAAGPYTDLAHRDFEAKDFASAIKQCDLAITYAPKWGDAWAIKGLALCELGRADDGIAALNKGVEVERGNSLPLVVRGDYFRGQKKFAEAIGDYTKSIEIEPTYDAYLGRAAAYEGLGMLDNSKADKEKAADLKSQDKSPKQ